MQTLRQDLRYGARRLIQMSGSKRTTRPLAVLLLAALLSLSICPAVTPVGAQDVSRFFKETEGAFVLYDLKNDRYVRYNEARCRQRFSPFSTFKIPNSLIGLDTKVITDAEYRMRWEPRKYPESTEWAEPPFVHWKQDQTLRSAIRYSVVWYYRELAKRVGAARMKKYVAAFAYGNQDISGGLASPQLFQAFWIRSSLQISADEQVEFLKKFYAGQLPVTARATAIVKDILVLEKTPTYTLSGKTGGGSLPNGKALGWFVGYVETQGNVCFFATNIEGANSLAVRDRRIELTRQILTDLGCLSQ
ncbi:MAG: penicillin-binding transpeptidase domain-containing protein [Blastocatellia bacterium]